LTHSFSKSYFEQKFKAENISDALYGNYPLAAISEVAALIENTPELAGINVTIPFKESIIPFLTELTPEAERIGAVNAVKIIRKQGITKTIGYNTDVYGFRMSLKPFLTSQHYRALVLGTGGASKAVVYALMELGIQVATVSREKGKGDLTWAEISEPLIRNYPLIINTTPLGMHPQTENYPPIPYSGIGKEHLLFDLIYNPDLTLFLTKGKAKGATVLNGLTMLKLQAEKSWEIWNS
ncbi:MAG TPA: shikimate dehydrogenase, partial [Flavobacteriales bacterium]|nr:shikimate dehydrogenase [Flavobacteriales bacterium]